MSLKEQLIEKCHNSIYYFDLFRKLKHKHKILIICLIVLGSISMVLFAVGTQYLTKTITIVALIFTVILSLNFIFFFLKCIQRYVVKTYPHLLKDNERFTIHTLENIQKFKLEKDVSHLIPIDKSMLWNLIKSFKDDLKIENVKIEKSLSDKFALPLIIFIITCLANHIFNNLEFEETIWLLGAVLYMAATAYAFLFTFDLLFIIPRKERKVNERKRLITLLEKEYFDLSIDPNI